VAVGEMIALFAEYGVRSNLRKEDYLERVGESRKGLVNTDAPPTGLVSIACAEF